MSRRYVLTYDIREDKIRLDAANLLQRYGRRVQGSVFECDLDEAALKRIKRQFRSLLAESEQGDLRAYRQCRACQDASFGIGDLRPGLGQDEWVVI